MCFRMASKLASLTDRFSQEGQGKEKFSLESLKFQVLQVRCTYALTEVSLASLNESQHPSFAEEFPCRF